MGSLSRISAAASTEEITGHIHGDGGVIVEGMFSTDTISALREDVLNAASNFRPGGATQGVDMDTDIFVGCNTIRFSSLGKVSPAFFDLLDNPVYERVADEILLPNCGTYWVNTGQAMLVGPGESEQILHRDCLNHYHVASGLWPNCPDIGLSAMIALDEFTEEVGATRVIPGSHKAKDIGDPGDPSQAVPAELLPGDALVYNGAVLHGAGPNTTTDRWRNAVHLGFLVGWLTPEESSPLDYSDEELSDKSTRVQQLLGHRSYQPLPATGGGLWLRHVSRIEEQPAVKFGSGK